MLRPGSEAVVSLVGRAVARDGGQSSHLQLLGRVCLSGRRKVRLPWFGVVVARKIDYGRYGTAIHLLCGVDTNESFWHWQLFLRKWGLNGD